MSRPLVDVMGVRRRRARALLKRRLTVLAVVLAVGGLMGGLVWLFYGSEVFTATTLKVSGTSLLTTEEVAATAAVPLGVPLASVDTAAAAERVRSIPEVAGVRASRAFPHTVTIAVTERQPLLATKVGTRFVWLDAQGVGFHRAAEVPPGVLPAELNVADERVTAAAAGVVTHLPPAVRGQAARLSASSVDSVVVHLADGRRVVWGSVDESDLKARVLTALMSVDAKTYDVSAPSHPTTR